MDAFSRRMEIVRILTYRRKEKISILSEELHVTERTIQSDITLLSLHFPIETVQGRYGCVQMIESYHPYKHILSFNQKNILRELLSQNILSNSEADVIRQILLELS